MADDSSSSRSQAQKKALRSFLLHLVIFVVVNLVLMIIPVFYDGKFDFTFEDRGPMLYGSIGWGLGLAIHGTVVLVDRLMNK